MNKFALTIFLLAMLGNPCESFAQLRKQPRTHISRADSVNVPISQQQLFIRPSKNMLVTHFDFSLGAGRVAQHDRSALSFAGTVQGLYPVTGAMYLKMGVCLTRINSFIKTDSLIFKTKNHATIASLPLGIGFTIGDDRAQIYNNIDFLPVYYFDHPTVSRSRTFTYGFGLDLGFHIRIRQRLHLGMMGKIQIFQPYDKDEPQSFPRYGFAGAGLLLRYD